MNTHVFDKVFKKPSLLAPAKHFRLELQNGNLYVLEMSKARPNTNLKRNSLNGMVANNMLDKFEEKFAKEYDNSIQLLNQIGIVKFSERKNCFCIHNFKNSGYQLNKQKGTLKIHSPKKIELFFDSNMEIERFIASIE